MCQAKPAAQPANFDSVLLDALLCEWMQAMEHEKLRSIVVLAPDAQDEEWNRTVVAVHPPSHYDMAMLLAMSDDFGQTWIQSNSSLAVRQTITASMGTGDIPWRSVAYKLGISTIVRVAIPIPGERMFECFLMSSKVDSDKSHASLLAWSALNVWAELKREIFQALCPLNDKELQSLALTFKGLSASEVAETMVSNERLINYYISRAMKKLGVENKMAAVQRVIWMGLI